MKGPLRTFVILCACFSAFAGLFAGCASLEPLPRFRTSSTSFDPEQIPIAQRSTSDLIDPSQVGTYSHWKQQAERRDAAAGIVEKVIVNRSAAPSSSAVDKVGLEIERQDDELTASDEFSAEEPPVDEGIIERVLQRGSLPTPVDDGEEENPAVNRAGMMQEIVNVLGARYQYGGQDAVRGIDCSAFVGTIYSRVFGVRLPRSSGEQFGVGSRVKKDDLKVGDLVFFKTRRRRGAVSHVGIYVGGSLFAHASSRHGVIISALDAGYYLKTFVGARRVLVSHLTDARRNDSRSSD
jgi:cell wall-associated NlpC family hydrolase